MARSLPSFTSSAPTALAHTRVTIGHLQLRDLIVCPRKRGVVNYIRDRSIVEHDLRSPDSSPRPVVDLSFVPNTIASLRVPDSDATLLAAGGLEADVHLSLHDSRSSRQEHGSSGGALWQFETRLPGSINNSVFLSCMNMTSSPETGFEPKIAVSNNDCTVKFYDIPFRGEKPPKALKESGILRLDVAVNHSSLSPDGRTLLSVGDSPKVYLHRVTGGRCTSFAPITTLTLPPPTFSPLNYSSSSPAASFSTAFSANGSKFAVASQEGSVVVWDVRSSKPLKIYHTDKTRPCTGKDGLGNGNGAAGGWLSDDPWDWSRGASKAPGWGVRSVKFGSGGDCGRPGKEVMVYTEHTSLVHIIDAQTFNVEEVVRMPTALEKPRRSPSSPLRTRTPSHVSSGPVFSQPSGHEQPHPPSIFLAFQDTFRIPSEMSSSQSSSSATRRRARRMRAMAGDAPAPVEEEDLVVIPPFGDRAVDSDVQRLLERHGIRSRRRDAYTDAEDVSVGEQGRGGAEMEVDELESDCASSHTPSRAASPVPSSGPAAANNNNNAVVPAFNTTFVRIPSGRTRRRTWTQNDFRTTREGRAVESSVPLTTPEEGDGDVDVDVDVDVNPGVDDGDSELDLAGTCFDPTGGYMYVASVNGVAEWCLRGGSKRWWVDSAWA